MNLNALTAWPQLTKCLTKETDKPFIIHFCTRYRDRDGKLGYRVLVSLIFLTEKDAQTCYDILIDNERMPEDIFQKLVESNQLAGQRLD